MRTFRSWLPVLLALIAVPPVLAEAPSAQQLRFFETNVRPILFEKCIKCHGSEKQWSNFRLDSRAALLAGGDNGPAVIPGQPDQSLLIKAVRQVDKELSMPPKGKLTDRQVADLEEWIKQGAAYPEIATASKTRFRDPNHWAFQSLTDPRPPDVQNEGWLKSPLDRFILKQLEAAGLPPASPADKRTLIRRATFDLTGLPPTPEEVAAFLADDRADAFARVVDRLLSSPAYGERWGRHWLDVARYADSNGLDENIAHGNAWRYRDYVVRSFNADKPFRQFVREQVAGDLLPAKDDEEKGEQLIATGFLSLGAKVLAEPDKMKMEMDIINEQLDTTGQAFLGLTLGCARCHDHKFDAISTADYYGLAGIFKSTLTMDSFKTIAQWHENPLPDPKSATLVAAHKQKLDKKKKEIQEVVDKADADAKTKVKPGTKPPAKLETLYPFETQAQLKRLRGELVAIEKEAPEVPSAMGVAENKVQDLPIHLRGDHLKLGKVVPRQVPVVFASLKRPEFSPKQSGRLELAQWLTDDRQALTYRVFVNRVWRWHFGKGIVRTPDNFGQLGETPTHPELLDWLASRFIEQGTSIKQLHRTIMLSSTYQEGSIPSGGTIERDPENILWGRAEIRRLEAEAVRDSLLAVAGQLDLTEGGSLLTVKNRAFFFDHTSKDKTEYNANRRSLYLPIVRNNIYDVFQLLDFPDAAVANGNRASTTIAPQALLMLNSDLIARASAGLADRVQAAGETDDAKIARLYSLAFTREVTQGELAADRAFLREAENLLTATVPDAARRKRMAWEALCQSFLAANEFTYVR